MIKAPYRSRRPCRWAWGAMVLWYKGAMVQWCDGAMVQMVHWCMVHCAIVPFRYIGAAARTGADAPWVGTVGGAGVEEVGPIARVARVAAVAPTEVIVRPSRAVALAVA